MFERAPFQDCPFCRRTGSFGILSVGGETLQRRCRECRQSLHEVLPAVDKAVIYLDQNAVSEIYKIKAKTRKAGAPNQATWENIERQTQRTYLSQQAIFPVSNIHDDETIVSPFDSELGLTHDMLSGDCSFKNTWQISIENTLIVAEAFVQNREPPPASFEKDHVLEGKRNAWLPDFHISANMNRSFFAAGIRANRDEGAARLRSLAQSWMASKPSFDELLGIELRSYGRAKREAFSSQVEKMTTAAARNDEFGMLDAAGSPIVQEYEALKRLFLKNGVSSSEVNRRIATFWDWPANREVLEHRIGAHLFAALGARMAAGQKRLPSNGMLNDITAISTYAPYVDAMFLDKECASLLSTPRVKSALNLSTKFFSLSTATDFVDYLSQLEKRASSDVRKYATESYGIRWDG